MGGVFGLICRSYRAGQVEGVCAHVLSEVGTFVVNREE